MFLEADPGANAYHRPRHLENVRFMGGDLLCKPGLSNFTPSALHDASACVISLEDYQVKPRRIYIPYFGCPGVSAAAGFTLVWFDTEQEPRFQRGTYYSAGTTSLVICPFSGQVLIGSDANLRRLNMVVAPYGQESLPISGTSQDEVIETFTTAFGHPANYTIGAMGQFSGKAFYGLDNGAASRIGTWDGLTIRNNDLTGINPVTAFGKWRDKLVAGHAAASNLIRLRTPGGAWSTVTPGAGTIASVRIVSFRDVLYITDGGANVWSYDGTTLAIVRTVAGSTMRALGVHNGFLYYGYQSSGARAVLGRFDGTTWTDAHKDLTTDDAACRLPKSLVSYRGSVYVAADTAADGGRIYESPGNNTSGTYVQYNPYGALNGNVIDAVVV